MTFRIAAKAPWVFAAGCLMVTLGVLAHLPMLAMARAMGYRLAGMPVDAAMIAGMVAIVGGVALAAYGLLPRDVSSQRAATRAIEISPPDEAPLSPAHWRLMAVLVVALVIDVMKPASLGFTIPGMSGEYAISRQTASLVPFFALTGTVVGSIVWGMIADVYGRKAAIMLSAVMFVGTSICGAMPSFAWNVAMCFMMGAAAGGMLPVTYALLAEMMPRKHRGWSLVLVGGLGAIGGYGAASGLSAMLQPEYGWRVLWLLNLPTGLLLILLGGLIPESAKFLLAHGRREEAHAIMQRSGAKLRCVPAVLPPANVEVRPLTGRAFIGKLTALSLAALCYGFVNFGLLLWLPTNFVARGYSVGAVSALIAQSSLIAIPTVFVAAYAYGRWSAKWSVIGSLALTIAGLVALLRLEFAGLGSLVTAAALLIIGTNALIAMLLPYAAESFPLRIRGRVNGIVAAFSKAGGMLAQFLVIVALVPSQAVFSVAVTGLVAAALVAVVIFGKETRGVELNERQLAQ